MFDHNLTRSATAATRWLAVGVILVFAATFTACSPDAEREETAAGTQPQAAGETEDGGEWISLFDGETLDGWRGLGRDVVPEGHWEVVDGTIHKLGSGDVPVQADGQPLEGGDLMTEETFADFEFEFEWKISEEGNSGVKYNVSEEMSTSNDPQYAALGFEYQVLDDAGHPDGAVETHQTGDLYDMISAGDDKPLNPVGEWNTSRIVFRGSHGEHWLNGEKVVEYDLDSDEFAQRLADSKYADIEGFADRRTGHIVLQDHGDDVWYRNLRLRRLPAM